jgi:hypothetical protein
MTDFSNKEFYLCIPEYISPYGYVEMVQKGNHSSFIASKLFVQK